MVLFLIICFSGHLLMAGFYAPELISDSQELVIITHPISQTECKDNTVYFTVMVSGGISPYTFQWQRQQPPSTLFEDFGAPVTGTLVTQTLKVEKVGVSGQNTNGSQYRVIVTDQSGTAVVISESAHLTVNEIAGYAGVSRVNHTICPGGNKSFEILTNGLPPLSYQWIKYEQTSVWQNVTDGGSLSGSTTSVLSFNEATPLESGRYRVRVVFPKTPEGTTCQRTYDTERILSVIPGIISGNQSVPCNTVPALLTHAGVPFDNNLGITYQWESATDSLDGWTDIPFATSPSFSPPVLNTTTWFRRRVISALCGSKVTDKIKIAVMDDQPPDFKPPGNIELCVDNLYRAEFVNGVVEREPGQDYFFLKMGNTLLDLDTRTISDNCCDPGKDTFKIRWTLDFGGPDPGESSLHGFGQPSQSDTQIFLPGDSLTFSRREHSITYWVTDCHGNESPPGTTTLIIRPRPQITSY